MKRRALLVLIVMLAGLVSCSTADKEPIEELVVVRQTTAELEREPVPGTETGVWVEPIYNTVRVPAQLDPSGMYYRPSHNAVVEIRPGRHQLVEFPEEESGAIRNRGGSSQ